MSQGRDSPDSSAEFLGSVTRSLTQEVELCGQRERVAVRDKRVISGVRRLHVIDRQLVGPGGVRAGVTTETTLAVTCGCVKTVAPGNALWETVSPEWGTS